MSQRSTQQAASGRKSTPQLCHAHARTAVDSQVESRGALFGIGRKRNPLPPRLGGGKPLIGHAVEFVRDPLAVLSRGVEAYGEIFEFRLAGRTVTVLTGPEAQEAFFRASDAQLSQTEVYRFTVPLFGRGIVYDCSPDLLSEQLSFLVPALRDKNMRTYAAHMARETREYIKNWPEEGEVDLTHICNELTTFIATRCLLGSYFREHMTTEFAHLLHDMEQALNQLAFYAPYLPIPAFRKRDRARARIGELIQEIIDRRRASGEREEDFLQALVDARYRNGRPLSDHEIAGLLLTIIFAGQHTSAVLAAWTGILLFQHPLYLPDILAEQVAVHGDGESISFESLKKVTRLDCAVMEAARLRPPLIMLMRQAVRELEYKSFRIPSGNLAMVSQVGHFDPLAFSNPHDFDPTRHAAPREESKRPYSMMTWGGGRHRCLGTHFAVMQVKAIWSIWLRELEFELVDTDYRPDFSGFVVGPRIPARMRYRKRRLPLSQTSDGASELAVQAG